MMKKVSKTVDLKRANPFVSVKIFVVSSRLSQPMLRGKVCSNKYMVMAVKYAISVLSQRPGDDDYDEEEDEMEEQGTLLTSLADAQARQREKAAYEQLKAGGLYHIILVLFVINLCIFSA